MAQTVLETARIVELGGIDAIGEHVQQQGIGGIGKDLGVARQALGGGLQHGGRLADPALLAAAHGLVVEADHFLHAFLDLMHVLGVRLGLHHMLEDGLAIGHLAVGQTGFGQGEAGGGGKVVEIGLQGALQGGFGLSPRETGLLVTPLVVCITVGSIVNGRLITRLRNPNVMLYGGFLLLALACAGIITTHRGTSHALLASYMFIAGLGLGFVMPNLTVFAQEVAGRAHLGIATALMQSLRMIGGMLGTAIVGTLVNHSYTARVKDALAANDGTQWTGQLTDPQILVNAQAQSDFLMTLAHMGQNGALFIESARSSLVAAIHNGQMMSLAAALAGLWFVRRVPLIRLTRGAKASPPPAE